MKIIHLKPEQKCLVVSDLHIGCGAERVDGLIPLLNRYDFVVLNGDILDLYSRSFEDLATNEGEKLIKWMINNSKKMIYIVGNHDFDMWKMSTRLSFPIHEAVKVEQLERSWVITHGHQFDSKHSAKPTKFTRFVSWVQRVINKVLRTNLQDLVIRRSKLLKLLAKPILARKIPKIRNNARKYAITHRGTHLIHGHSHFPNIERLGSGKRIIDQGSFVIGRSYVIIKDGVAELKIIE